jgi:hypothetical protein
VSSVPGFGVRKAVAETAGRGIIEDIPAEATTCA